MIREVPYVNRLQDIRRPGVSVPDSGISTELIALEKPLLSAWWLYERLAQDVLLENRIGHRNDLFLGQFHSIEFQKVPRPKLYTQYPSNSVGGWTSKFPVGCRLPFLESFPVMAQLLLKSDTSVILQAAHYRMWLGIQYGEAGHLPRDYFPGGRLFRLPDTLIDAFRELGVEFIVQRSAIRGTDLEDLLRIPENRCWLSGAEYVFFGNEKLMVPESYAAQRETLVENPEWTAGVEVVVTDENRPARVVGRSGVPYRSGNLRFLNNRLLCFS